MKKLYLIKNTINLNKISLHFPKLHRRPFISLRQRFQLQPMFFRFFSNRFIVFRIEAAEKDDSVVVQHVAIGFHIAQEDVAVDVGKDYVVMLGAKCGGVAQQDCDGCCVVDFQVVAGVVVRPFVVVNGGYGCGAFFLCQDGDDACSATHV